MQENADVWNVREQSIDLRLGRSTFAAVQKYVPECHVLIQNVEAHVQMAEAQMFPAKLQEEEMWSQEVLNNVLKTKVHVHVHLHCTCLIHWTTLICLWPELSL